MPNMTDHSTRSQSHFLWRFFKSLKLTLFLLMILALASVVGTLIPQHEGALEMIQGWSPSLGKLVGAFQLFDLYHSHWFRIIIGFLAMNLVVCSLDRLPSTLKLFRHPSRPARSTGFDAIPPERSIYVTGKKEEIVATVQGVLKRHYKRLKSATTANGDFIFGEKGRYAYFGVYIVHCSVLLILAGGIIGSLFGFEAFVNIPEGTVVDRVILTKTRVVKPLPFTVACEKFTVDYYDNGTPREYRSDLKFFQKGREVLEGKLRVNHPITFQGITFYQASLGEIPTVTLRLTRTGSSQEEHTYKIQQGRSSPLPGDEGHFGVIDAHENFQGTLGPAALIAVHPRDGEERRIWVFQNPENLKKRFPARMLASPKLDPSSFEPYTFYLDTMESRYYTGLQVNRDPGVPLVLAGFFMIMIGLMATFFMSHKRIWIRVSGEGDKTGIAVLGRSSKNPFGMERELDRIMYNLKKEITPGAGR